MSKVAQKITIMSDQNRANITLTSLKLHESPTHQIAVCYLNSAMMSWISLEPATPVLLTY